MKQKHSHRLCSVIVSIIVVLIVLIAVSLFWVNSRLCFVDYTPYSYSESGDAIKNPYVGLYSIRGYMLAEDATFSLPETNAAIDSDSSAFELSLIEINLKNYSDSDISTNALTQLDKMLTICTQAKKQVILRFLYDWDGKALSAEPSSLPQIKKHISRLSTVVNKHSDCVYILQGTFTGNNGEMNNSNYGDLNQIRQIIEELDNDISREIYLAVRTPAQLRGILRTSTPLSSSEAYSGTLASRLSLFNDGMLGSVYDLGTYGSTPLKSSSKPEEQGTRSDELLFQYKLCQYVPNGGEVTVDNEYNDLDNAISDLSQMHVSYLNSEHDEAVLNKWKNSTYTGSDTDVFSGCSGYDYISAHLGYRYVVQQSSIDFHSVLDDTATLYLTVANTGFSSAYTKFTTDLILTSKDTGKSEKVETTIDNRSIAGNDFSEFKLSLNVRSLKKGTYTVSLRMKDPYTKNYIHFANKGYEKSKTAPVGTLTLQ